MHSRRRIGSMSGCSALPRKTWKTGVRRSVCGFGLAILLAADAVLASGQTMRRPALRSGTASVVLIARVESLSVVANVATAGGPVVAGEPAELQPFSITTSWAVPANFTTFRLTRYFAGPEAIAAGQLGAGPGVAEARPFAGDSVSSLVVESGETNEARTRNDLLDAVGGGEKSSDEGEFLNILVQAL